MRKIASSRREKASVSSVYQGRPRFCPVCEQTKFDIEFRVVDMTDLQRTIAVAWGPQLQFEVERLLSIGGSMALALRSLAAPRPLVHCPAEGHITGRWHTFLLASSLEGNPASIAVLLLLRLVLSSDYLRA